MFVGNTKEYEGVKTCAESSMPPYYVLSFYCHTCVDKPFPALCGLAHCLASATGWISGLLAASVPCRIHWLFSRAASPRLVKIVRLWGGWHRASMLHLQRSQAFSHLGWPDAGGQCIAIDHSAASAHCAQTQTWLKCRLQAVFKV